MTVTSAAQLDELLRRVAEAVRDETARRIQSRGGADSYVMARANMGGIDLDAIIARVKTEFAPPARIEDTAESAPAEDAWPPHIVTDVGDCVSWCKGCRWRRQRGMPTDAEQPAESAPTEEEQGYNANCACDAERQCDYHAELLSKKQPAESAPRKRPQATGEVHTCREDGDGPECLACTALDEREDSLHPIVNPLDGSRWRFAPEQPAESAPTSARVRSCDFCGLDEARIAGPLYPTDEPPLSSARICGECAGYRAPQALAAARAEGEQAGYLRGRMETLEETARLLEAHTDASPPHMDSCGPFLAGQIRALMDAAEGGGSPIQKAQAR